MRDDGWFGGAEVRVQKSEVSGRRARRKTDEPLRGGAEGKDGWRDQTLKDDALGAA